MSTAHLRIPHNPRQNHLLATLSADELERLHPHFELVSMSLGEVLCRSGCKLNHAYFPTTAIVSLFYITKDGESTEIALIGNDGFVGITFFTGGNSMPQQFVVQSAGYAYRLNGQLLLQEFNHVPSVTRLLLRYTQALLTQIGQMAMCNRHHSVEQQFCRLLLLSLDRLPSNELIMTQELIANMLGVRRESVTEAAIKLERNGLIHYHRGHITVPSRSRLETKVCECYKVVKKEYDRLFPDIIAA